MSVRSRPGSPSKWLVWTEVLNLLIRLSEETAHSCLLAVLCWFDSAQHVVTHVVSLLMLQVDLPGSCQKKNQAYGVWRLFVLGKNLVHRRLQTSFEFDLQDL